MTMSKNNNNKNRINSDKPRDEIRKRFRFAQQLEKQGQWRKATRMLQEILTNLDPSDAHSHLALARLQARRGLDASPIFEAGTKACPESVHLLQAYAVYTMSTYDNKDVSMGDSIANFNSSTSEVEAPTAATLPTTTISSPMDKAQSLFEQALLLEPYNPYVCHSYGWMIWNHGNDSKRAQALWERALEQSSTAALVCSLGSLMIAQRDFCSARILYETHSPLLISEREKIEVTLAWAWLEERYFGNIDRAEELIAKALTLSPRSSVAQVALARLEGRRQQQRSDSRISKLDNENDKRDFSCQQKSLSSTGRIQRDAAVRRLESTCQQIESDSPEKRPVDGRIYNAWANMEVKAKRFKEARDILYRGLSRYPLDHSLLQAAGKVEERLGNYTGATELYGASLFIQPSAPTLVSYALLELRQTTALAFQSSNTSSKLIVATESDDNNPFSSKIKRIMRLFEEALMVDKRHGPAYNAYGRAIFEHLHDEDKARLIFERGVRANCTDSASIYHGYARLELVLGNIDRARELLLQGNQEVRRFHVETDSPHRDRGLFLTHTLGMLELNTNRPSAALEVFREGIERYGNSSQLLLGSALSESKLGNEPKARELFERSVFVDEKHAQAWQAWGVMEMKAGNLLTAKTLFDCGIRSVPRHTALFHTYGILESRLGNVEAARALFQKGIAIDPKHIAIYQSWASLELRESHFDVAKVLIAQALTLDKRNGSGWLIASEIEERLGNVGISSLLLRRGIECAPSHAQLYRALGSTLVRQGKIIEAREILEQGIDIDPMYAPLYHTLAELEARICNIEGLAKLNKRAALIFNTNALAEPTSSDVWGSKLRAGRSCTTVPRVVTTLAQRIVDDDPNELRLGAAEPLAFLEHLLSPTQGLILGDILDMGDDGTHRNSTS